MHHGFKILLIDQTDKQPTHLTRNHEHHPRNSIERLELRSAMRVGLVLLLLGANLCVGQDNRCCIYINSSLRTYFIFGPTRLITGVTPFSIDREKAASMTKIEATLVRSPHIYS